MAEKLAIAGSVNVLVFTNVAESIVHSGAKPKWKHRHYAGRAKRSDAPP